MMRSLFGKGSIPHLDPDCEETVHGHDGLDILLAASVDLGHPRTREAIHELCERGTRLLLLVDGLDALDLPWVATCKAQGFLDWSELEPRILADAVADVMAGKFYVSATLARRLIVRAGQASADGSLHLAPVAATLTPREIQVLRLVAEGLSNKQVSRRLQISEHAVKRLVGNILAKLNCPNRTLAVVRALEDGLLAG